MNALPDPTLMQPNTTGLSRAPIGAPAMELGDMLVTLWLGKWRIVFMAIASAIAGLAWAIAIAEPRYRAIAVVVLDGGRDPVVEFSDFLPMMSGDATVVNTELEVLRSVSLLADVVAQANLTADPEFNPALRSPTIAETTIHTTLDLLGVPPAPPLSLERIERRALTATIASLREALTVRNVPDSMVFEITLETGNADGAAMLVNLLADRYLVRQLETKFEATQRATAWLNEKVAVLEVDLEASESATNQFAAQMELISAETLEVLSQDLKGVRDRISARQATIDRGEGTSDAVDRIGQLRILEAELSDKIARQSQDLVSLEQLEREAAANGQIYEYFLSRLKETTVQEGIQQADARLLSAAMIPEVPSTPRPTLATILCAAVGAFVGAISVIAIEARSATFRTAEALESATRLPVLGQIPLIPVRHRQSILDYIRQKPNSAPVEAIRNLRTSLTMTGTGPAPRVILSTSSLPGEGKTTHTLALAQNLTGVSNKVLVIEGDIRRRVFHEYFGAQGTPTMMQVLSGKSKLEDAVWHSPDLGFDILFGDDAPENPADIFSSRAFRQLIRTARKSYDVVLIDTPPVLLVPDARVIGALADAILYTVRWDKTREKQVLQGIRAFETVGLQITGTVLSQINMRGMKKYGYGQDHGTYGASGYFQS